MNTWNEQVTGLGFVNFHNSIYDSGAATINPGAILVSSGNASFYSLAINSGSTGPEGLWLDNSHITTSFSAEINTNILGLGTFEFYPWHDGSSSETINGFSLGVRYDLHDQGGPLGTSLTISHPEAFYSPVDLVGNVVANPHDTTSVTLQNLPAMIDSYDFKNEFLTLYNGNRPVYTLRLDNQTPNQIYVQATGSAATISFVPNSHDLPVHLPAHNPLAGLSV